MPTSTATRPLASAAAAPLAALPTATTLPEAPVLPAVLVTEASAPAAEPAAPPRSYLPARSLDGRFVLTDTTLTVLGQSFGLRELERAEVQPVRWVLWVLVGALGLATVLILFLQNRLHTLPAMLGLAATALLLAYGYRGTNRLRLWRLGREAAHLALPGSLASWQRLVSDLNRRIGRAHDQAAAEAAALLAPAPAPPPAPESLPPAPPLAPFTPA